MLDDGYSIEEVDKMTGPAVGRPKSATFRTFDIVGLDVFTHVIKNFTKHCRKTKSARCSWCLKCSRRWSSAVCWVTRPKPGSIKAEGRRRQARDLDARHCDARLSPAGESQTSFARHGEEHRRPSRADQSFDVGQRSAPAPSLEDAFEDLTYAAKRIPRSRHRG